ncbi:hypothetical protein [Mucilaginibacter ginsenosidivorax]|uniref:Uncharacterized protein n=1 Tax=Mucilaginibacter ginsenosidivorax TaxID=862126 RepID=A0A5B8W525_9SPHI|nr:hypothetical protein [Mucilaginibacter ginsenosidivorax]QEC78751.1 hypothetical protein FSB76_23405 [Mucilaginibacter ginsenosidivorax]
MTKADILSKIDTVLPMLQQWMQYKEVVASGADMDTIKELAAVIVPERTWCWTCPAGKGELLTIIYSYYQRESQK